jgi:hypothetical protein
VLRLSGRRLLPEQYPDHPEHQRAGEHRERNEAGAAVPELSLVAAGILLEPPQPFLAEGNHGRPAGSAGDNTSQRLRRRRGGDRRDKPWCSAGILGSRRLPCSRRTPRPRARHPRGPTQAPERQSLSTNAGHGLLKAQILELERQAGNLSRAIREGLDSSTVRADLVATEQAIRAMRTEFGEIETRDETAPPVGLARRSRSLWTGISCCALSLPCGRAWACLRAHRPREKLALGREAVHLQVVRGPALNCGRDH